jgi:hypothetical protein
MTVRIIILHKIKIPTAHSSQPVLRDSMTVAPYPRDNVNRDTAIPRQMPRIPAHRTAFVCPTIPLCEPKQICLGTNRVGDEYLNLLTRLAAQIAPHQLERTGHACVDHDETRRSLELAQPEVRHELTIHLRVQFHPVSATTQSARRDV